MSHILRTFAVASLLALTAGCDFEARVELPFAGHPTVHVVYRSGSSSPASDPPSARARRP